MRPLWMALCALSVFSVGCGAPVTRALRLPPPTESLETRVVAYRALSAMPHRNWSGWRMRMGVEPEIADVGDARSWMQNSPEATQVFEDYDSTRRLGIGLMSGGIAGMLIGPVAMTTALASRDTRADAATITVFSVVTLAGAIAATIGSIMIGGTEHFVPEAAEAYNRWLWRRLALPERIAPEAPVEGTVPTPANGLTTQSPW